MTSITLQRRSSFNNGHTKKPATPINTLLQRLFGRRQGRVELVGSGPGDPELLTRKAWRLLQACDVLVYDALVSQALLDAIPSRIKRIYVGKRMGQHSVNQAEICTILVQQAQKGLNVVRLKGGDPLIFGRLGEEVDALIEAGIDYSIVPGITAASGSAAALGMPLTERETAPRLRLITAQFSRERAIDWANLANSDETLVFYMGLSKAPTISAELISAGLPPDYPVLLVENGTLPQQRSVITTLAELPEAVTQQQLSGPTLIYVSRVISQRQLLIPVAGMAAYSAQ